MLNVDKDVEQMEIFIHCWENKFVYPLAKTIWQSLLKLNIHIHYDLAIQLLVEILVEM